MRIREIGDDMMRECEEIKRQLPISSYSRPAWDLETLGAMKLQEFFCGSGNQQQDLCGKG